MLFADLMDDLAKHINNNKAPTAVFIDFKTNFDTLDHTIHSNKLKANDITDNPLKWLQDYVNNRQQCVLTHNVKSSLQPIITGVPQGSILGPLLFNLYTNDLPQHLQGASTQLYADDTVVYQDKPFQPETLSSLQIALNQLADWCSNNKLTINAPKTKVVHFVGRSHRNPKLENPKLDGPQLHLNEIQLEQVNHHTFLGTVLDCKLNGNEQTKKVIQTTNLCLGTLAKIRPYIVQKTALQIYKSMILPIPDYNSLIYFFTSSQNTQKLQRLQNRAVRLITKTGKTTTITDIQHQLKLQPHHERRYTQLLTLMNHPSKQERHTQTPTGTTRQSAKLDLKAPTPTQLIMNAPCYKGTVFLNNLPESTQRTENVKSFKNIIKHSKYPGP